MSVKKYLLVFLAVCLPVFPFSTPAGENPSTVADNLRSGGSICTSVRDIIQEGTESKAVVRTALELGHSACVVVQCALEAGGELEGVLAGAIEAGARTDVISRCAIDVGADPGRVAQILTRPEMMLSLCYFPPEGAEFFTLPEETVLETAAAGGSWDPFPTGDRWQNISPHTF